MKSDVPEQTDKTHPISIAFCREKMADAKLVLQRGFRDPDTVSTAARRNYNDFDVQSLFRDLTEEVLWHIRRWDHNPLSVLKNGQEMIFLTSSTLLESGTKKRRDCGAVTITGLRNAKANLDDGSHLIPCDE